jgi:hypothetical protein
VLRRDRHGPQFPGVRPSFATAGWRAGSATAGATFSQGIEVTISSQEVVTAEAQGDSRARS